MPQPTQPPDAREIVARLAAELATPGFPRGDLAALRRMDPDAPGRTPVLLRMLARHAADRLDCAVDELGRWALVLHAMALMAPEHHRTQLPAGRSLRGNGPNPLSTRAAARPAAERSRGGVPGSGATSRPPA